MAESMNRIMSSNLQLVERIQYFHDAVQAVEEPLSDAQLTEMILKYVRHHGFFSGEPQD